MRENVCECVRECMCVSVSACVSACVCKCECVCECVSECVCLVTQLYLTFTAPPTKLPVTSRGAPSTVAFDPEAEDPFSKSDLTA